MNSDVIQWLHENKAFCWRDKRAIMIGSTGNAYIQIGEGENALTTVLPLVNYPESLNHKYCDHLEGLKDRKGKIISAQ